uniref:Zinc knuckle CX2CX4HX4C n=1 Tax=Tanacetum cinerariifolium TaxID=118510 RepID=A0A699GTA4_TANCI|nr:hypothetical protein [Tanacetum cinerariifolium]
MCQYEVGKTDFDRVLVEIEANKKLGDKIEIEYIEKNESVKGTKEIEVMYDWKRDACPHCCVFGHSWDTCMKRPRTEEEVKANAEAVQREKEKNMATQKEGFTEVQNRRKLPQNQNKNWQQKMYNDNISRGKNQFDVLNEVDTSEGADDKWESDRLKEHEEQCENVEDVLENMNGIGQTMTGDTVIGESSHWQYKFPLPLKVVPTARRLEMPLPEVCTIIQEMMKKLAVPKPPSDDEGPERLRKTSKKSNGDEGPSDPQGSLK